MKTYKSITHLGFILIASAIAVLQEGSAMAATVDESKEVSGQVLTQDNLPAIGAAVMIKGTTQGAIVDDQGYFTIQASPSDTLMVSMIGYEDAYLPVGNRFDFKVWLEEMALDLENSVVVAYGVQNKATITGAINSIGNEEILRAPTANITNALAGTMAGLTTVQRSGEPGKDAATFRIRGIGTLNSGDEAAPLIIIDGVERDSNGVIIVTTRTGTEGKPKVTFSANFGWQSYTVMPELVNAAEWIMLYNEGIENDGSDKQKFPQEVYEAYLNNTNPVIYSQTDWVEALLKDAAPQQQYNVNVSGGTEKVKYFVSFGLLHQSGIYRDYDVEGVDYSINPDYKRYNIRANIDAELLKGLTLKLRMGAAISDGNYANATNSGIFNGLLATTPFGPNVIDGKFISGYSGDDPITGLRKNSAKMLEIYESGYQQTNISKYNLSAELNYNMDFITKGLSISGKVAYDDIGNYTVKFTPGSLPTYRIVIGDEYEDGYTLVRAEDSGAMSSSESYGTRYKNLYLEAAINYARNFGKHKVTALALYNQRTQENPSFSFDLPKGLLGFVGRVTYNYDNRYLAEFNVGYNGSENFAEGRRFGLFPAFSLGWILTEEKFIPKNNILTYAKIRGSYGEVGNDQIGKERYLYLPTTYDYPKNGYNWGTYGQDVQYWQASAEGKVGNPYVTWERARKANIGLEIKMFDSQLSFTGDYFYEYRDNILWDYGTVPSIVGYDPAPANIGIVSNRGFEMELGWNSRVGEFSYWLNGVFSFARNRIEYMDEPTMAYSWMQETGFSVGQYKGYLNEGFINTVEELENQPQHSWGGNYWDRGELNFIDINGDGIVNNNDRIPIGYSEYPEVTFGLNLGFRWKGLEFSALLQGATNVTLYLKQEAICPLYLSRSAQKWHLGRWTEERYLAGEEITYPRMLSDNMNSPSFINPDPMSTFWLMDATYLRLRNVELAYNFRFRALGKAGISNIRLALSGNNLLTWTGVRNYDPESPSGKGEFYPMQKVYNVGLKIIF